MPDLDIYSLLKTELMVGIPDGLADKFGDMRKAEDGLCILDEAAIDIIKKLEKELGVSLFTKQGGRLVPTEGSIVLKHVKEMAAIKATTLKVLQDPC